MIGQAISKGEKANLEFFFPSAREIRDHGNPHKRWCVELLRPLC